MVLGCFLFREAERIVLVHYRQTSEVIFFPSPFSIFKCNEKACVRLIMFVLLFILLYICPTVQAF